MKPVEIRTLFGYGYWAFEKVWASIDQLSDAQFIEDLDYSRGSVRNQVVHMMSATRRWIVRMSGGEMVPHLAFEDFATRAEARSKWDVLRAEAMDYINGLTETDLDGIIRWQLPDRGMEAGNTRWQILMHVANHATDHRAQILAMLNQHFGIETPEQDMLFYLLENA